MQRVRRALDALWLSLDALLSSSSALEVERIRYLPISCSLFEFTSQVTEELRRESKAGAPFNRRSINSASTKGKIQNPAAKKSITEAAASVINRNKEVEAVAAKARLMSAKSALLQEMLTNLIQVLFSSSFLCTLGTASLLLVGLFSF